MKYKNYNIDETINEWGYHEATPNDCDGLMLHAKTIKELKTEIDETN